MDIVRKVILEFKDSHHYEKEYIKTNMYCPLCGVQGLWMETGEGDYYLGSDYLCTSCKSSHYCDNHNDELMEEYEAVILQITNGYPFKPTTREGK